MKHFLLAAKKATYAAQGDNASITPLLIDTKQLEYKEGEFFYRDIYAGMFQFVGQEIVYLADRAIWSMSYSGGLCANIETAIAPSIYTFLRQALRNPPSELPLRGPSSLEQGTLRYTCQSTGSIERFHGVETITRGDNRLYELHFSGGNLS